MKWVQFDRHVFHHLEYPTKPQKTDFALLPEFFSKNRQKRDFMSCLLPYELFDECRNLTKKDLRDIYFANSRFIKRKHLMKAIQMEPVVSFDQVDRFITYILQFYQNKHGVCPIRLISQELLF